MKKTITKAEHLQLIGLLTIAEQHYKMVEEARQAINTVLGTDDEHGDVSDVIYGDRPLKWLLGRNGITVKAKP